MRSQLNAMFLLTALLCAISLAAADPTPAPAPPSTASGAQLDAVLHVHVDEKLAISCRFDLPGKADQMFQNTEYRYALLDAGGVQIKDNLTMQLPVRTIKLPMDKKSVTDATDAQLDPTKLKPGEEYYLVISVRNLTGLAKFKAPE